MSRNWESVFTTWSQGPSKTEQERAENAERQIRQAIQASTKLQYRNINVFTQGSYRNRVNVRRDSDVDIGVVCFDAFFLDYQDDNIKAQLNKGFSDGIYTYAEFKNELEEALVQRFGRHSVSRSSKSFDIKENTYRVESDVAAFFEHRRYTSVSNYLKYDLKSLFHELTAEDRLIFYYVGHGFHNGVDSYLSTYDMHPFNVAETAVSLRTILLDPLSQSKCKTAMIFIDACAQPIQDENSRNTLSNIDADEIRLLSSELNYLASYFSCQPEQSSYSCDELKQGIWTYHLVRAINGEVNEVIADNQYITDKSLGDYLGKNVAEYANEQLGYDQNPRSILDSNSEYLFVKVFKD